MAFWEIPGGGGALAASDDSLAVERSGKGGR
jgi:hypothetical protein